MHNVILSVFLSVYNTTILCQNGLTYLNFWVPILDEA